MDRALVPAVVAFPAIPAEADSRCCQHPVPVFRVNRGHCILCTLRPACGNPFDRQPKTCAARLGENGGGHQLVVCSIKQGLGCCTLLQERGGKQQRTSRCPPPSSFVSLVYSDAELKKADWFGKQRISEAPALTVDCAVCIAGRCPMIDIFIHHSLTLCTNVNGPDLLTPVES